MVTQQMPQSKDLLQDLSLLRKPMALGLRLFFKLLLCPGFNLLMAQYLIKVLYRALHMSVYVFKSLDTFIFFIFFLPNLALP